MSLFGSIKKSLSKKEKSPRTTSAATPGSNSPTSRSGHLTTQNNDPFESARVYSSSSTRRPDRPGMNAFTVPSNEPPPAYTPGPAPFAAELPATSAPTMAASTDDDPYAFLRSFDTIFLIDDSGSMAGRSWRETGKALETITPICTQRDADGIDIHFLNHPDSSLYRNVSSAGTVVEIFQTVRPSGATPTGQRLNRILRNYVKKFERAPDSTKPINLIVITDGAPSDDVESPIIAVAKKLDKLEAPPWQVGIQFFQVGKEPGAREALKQLDDSLAEIAGDEELRDIVDTVPFMGEGGEELSATGIMKVVLGSVNRRIDRNSKELHRQR